MTLKVEWVVCLVLLSKVSPSHGVQKRCAEPSHKELSRKLDHWAPTSVVTSARHLVPGKEFKASHSQTSQIGERSTSPWSYRVNEDKARYPRRLMEAYCLHKGCLGADGHIVESSVSVPYYTRVLVLRRTPRCKRKTHVYKPVEEKIPVFCVCVMAKVAKS
ncbi:interleukin-17D-like [Heptranchias perlo]|uniref:interleukin-17D-like n=1 Tax=Heptranchias perlo TaxID=212740 RepID=UPI00355A1CAE